MAIVSTVTLPYVASRTRRVPVEPLEHFARFLRDWVLKEFEDNQTHAAKALGVTQGHISAMMRGDRGPGLNTLILMREKTGRSIDELLGFSAPPPEENIGRMLASLELDVARIRAEARKNLEAANAKVAEAAEAERAERRPKPPPRRRRKV